MNLKTIQKYLSSFFKKDWELYDYPLIYKNYEIKENENPNPERFQPIASSIQIINWPQMSGNGVNQEEALENLKFAFKNYKQNNKKLPRPGTKAPLFFAEHSEIEKYLDLVDDFLLKILGVDPKGAIVTDQSSLWDFHFENSNDPIYKKIKEIYNVDVSDIDKANIIKIVKKINNLE
jgi:hypothetical protein